MIVKNIPQNSHVAYILNLKSFSFLCKKNLISQSFHFGHLGIT